MLLAGEGSVEVRQGIVGLMDVHVVHWDCLVFLSVTAVHRILNMGSGISCIQMYLYLTFYTFLLDIVPAARSTDKVLDLKLLGKGQVSEGLRVYAHNKINAAKWRQ